MKIHQRKIRIVQKISYQSYKMYIVKRLITNYVINLLLYYGYHSPERQAVKGRLNSLLCKPLTAFIPMG